VGKKNTLNNSVRIIAGKWRHRRLSFPDLPSLKPTQDQIRETLFNWLSPVIADSVCLDLFAGSGALGFEALSRGAGHVTFVDSHPEVVLSIEKNAELLLAAAFDISRARVPSESLAFRKNKYDIVFLDPPFKQGLLLPSLQWLRASQYIHADSLIYVEIEKSLRRTLDLSGYEVVREKATKHVAYGLLRFS